MNLIGEDTVVEVSKTIEKFNLSSQSACYNSCTNIILSGDNFKSSKIRCSVNHDTIDNIGFACNNFTIFMR